MTNPLTRGIDFIYNSAFPVGIPGKALDTLSTTSDTLSYLAKLGA